MLSTILAVLSACPAKDEGDSDPAPDSSSSSSASVGETGALTEPIDSGASEDTGATDPGATDPGDTTTTGMPETTTATDGAVTETDATTGQAWPAECVEVDPDVAATYTLEVAGWPLEGEKEGELSVPCSIDAVTAAADTVSTTLTCEVEGEPHAATLVISASPEGPVSWAAGDPVKLIAEIWDEGDFGGGRNVQLRATDDALLLSASEAYIDEGFNGRFAPLTVRLELACDEAGSDYVKSPLRMDITPVDGPVVSIFSDHRGVVPIDANQQFAVDLEQTFTDGGHLPVDSKVLLRRVNIGG